METLHPGLYLQEVKGEAPVQGVSTSTGAFVGVALKGDVGKSNLVTSWNEFLEKYGGYTDNSYLAYAVRGFFENGGTRAFISRVVKLNAGVKTSAKATATFLNTAVTPANALIVDALTDGTHGNALKVVVSAVSGTTFTLEVLENDISREKYSGVTLASVDDIVNAESKLVRVTVLASETALAVATKSLAGGNDGLTGLSGTDYTAVLPQFDAEAINLLAIPGVTDVAVLNGAKTYAEGRKDVYVIAEVPMGSSVTAARDYKVTTANISSPRVALYYTWGKVADPIGVGKNPVKTIPVSGHVMGVFARTDGQRGVFKAPAGVDAQLNGIIGLERNLSDAEQDLLNPIGVNVIRAFPGGGITIWGARSTQVDGEFRYVPVRRSHDYVGQTILANTRWTVFEPNDEQLWGKITSSVEDFLRGFWRAGGLRGTDEKQAFFVKCDAETTTVADIEAGRVNVEVGVAHQKPAEFTIFRLSVRK